MRLVAQRAAAAAVVDSKPQHRSRDAVAASASPSQSVMTVRSARQQREPKATSVPSSQRPSRSGNRGAAASKKPGGRTCGGDSAAARSRPRSCTGGGRLSGVNGGSSQRHGSSGTSASANGSSSMNAAQDSRPPGRHTAKQNPHAGMAAAMPDSAFNVTAEPRRTPEQQRRAAGPTSSEWANALQGGQSEEPLHYLLTMRAAFDEGDGRPGSARGVFSGTVTPVAGNGTPLAAHNMTVSAGRASSVQLPAALDTAAPPPDAEAVSAADVGRDTAPASAGAATADMVHITSVSPSGGGETAAPVSWRENPTARRTRESSFYSVRSQSESTDCDGSGVSDFRSNNSGSSSRAASGSSSGGGAASDAAGWRSNAVSEAGYRAPDSVERQAGGDVPHLLDVDDAAEAALMAARATADESSSRTSSNGSREGGSSAGSNNDGAPLIQLAHADSGQLRTATVDSDCPTGLEFAAAATSSDVAWPPPHLQQQQRANAGQAMPAQQQLLRSAESGRLWTATTDSDCSTGLLFVPAAPERISEVGDASTQPGPNTAHPAAQAAQAAAPSGHSAMTRPRTAAAAPPAASSAAVGQPTARSGASAPGGRARSASSPRRLRRRKPALKQRRHLVGCLPSHICMPCPGALRNVTTCPQAELALHPRAHTVVFSAVQN